MHVCIEPFLGSLNDSCHSRCLTFPNGTPQFLQNHWINNPTIAYNFFSFVICKTGILIYTYFTRLSWELNKNCKSTVICRFRGLSFLTHWQMAWFKCIPKKVPTTYLWGWLVESTLCQVSRSIRQNKKEGFFNAWLLAYISGLVNSASLRKS